MTPEPNLGRDDIRRAAMTSFMLGLQGNFPLDAFAAPKGAIFGAST
jgi:hypothetical protein